MLRHPEKDSRERAEKAFSHLQKRLDETVGEFISLSLRWSCPVAEQDHRSAFRQFAHVFHDDDPGAICVAAEIGQLDDEYLYGILAHEFGHLIAQEFHEDDSEDGADLAAEEYLGIPIYYRTRYDLEWIPRDLIWKLRK